MDEEGWDKGLEELARAIALSPASHSPSTYTRCCAGDPSWDGGRESGIGMSCLDPQKKHTRHPERTHPPLLGMAVSQEFLPALFGKYRTKLHNI